MEDQDQEIEIEISRRPKPGWATNLTDFANMVKAFIGSNYLSVAYAFKQSGLGLGIIGFLVIASLTDHCCHMIVKIKHATIEKLATVKTSDGKPKKKYYTVNKRSGTPGDSGVDETSDSGDERVTAPLMNNTEDDSDDIFGDDDDDNVQLREYMFKHMTYGDIGKLSFGSFGVGIVNFCIAMTQFGFCVGYSIFIGNTIHSLIPKELCYENNGTHCSPFVAPTKAHVKRSVNDSEFLRITLPSTFLNTSETTFDSFAETLNTTIAPQRSTTAAIEANTTTSSPNVTTELTSVTPNTTYSPNVTTVADFIKTVTSKAPDLKVLVTLPLPVFICFALIRNVRYLGFISMLANASILVGLVALTGFLISGFAHDGMHHIAWFNWDTFPVFFGMVTGSFEGIGLVIPIESSMEGNGVSQMLNQNLPAGNPLSIAVNVTICLGILLTFPLQMFPVIEIIEKYLFTEGRLCGPKRDAFSSERTQLTDEDTQPLMGDVAVHVPASVPTWKRNLLRLIVVCCATGLAVLLKDNFAYVGGFVGAVGSSVLAYILPCLFHLKLCWHDISIFVRTKDIAIVIFGLVASLISAYTVVQEIVQNTKV